jgi:hypothetical protein
MTFRRQFELMNNGIGNFQTAEYFPEFKTPEGDVQKDRFVEWKEKWNEFKFLAVDFANQVHAKIKTYPPTYVLIGLVVTIIIFAEIITACFKVCFRRRQPKVHEQ